MEHSLHLFRLLDVLRILALYSITVMKGSAKNATSFLQLTFCGQEYFPVTLSCQVAPERRNHCALPAWSVSEQEILWGFPVHVTTQCQWQRVRGDHAFEKLTINIIK